MGFLERKRNQELERFKDIEAHVQLDILLSFHGFIVLPELFYSPLTSPQNPSIFLFSGGENDACNGVIRMGVQISSPN
jgi:hypothetical protein